MEYAISLCDLLMDLTNDDIHRIVNRYGCNRLYIGSYFCANYFIKCNKYNMLHKYVKITRLKITLVVPILYQKLQNTALSFYHIWQICLGIYLMRLSVMM